MAAGKGAPQQNRKNHGEDNDFFEGARPERRERLEQAEEAGADNRERVARHAAEDRADEDIAGIMHAVVNSRERYEYRERDDPERAATVIDERDHRGGEDGRSVGRRQKSVSGRRGRVSKARLARGGTEGRAAGGGRGLVDSLYAAAQRNGIDVFYLAEARQLLHDDDGVHGVRVRIDGRTRDIAYRRVLMRVAGSAKGPAIIMKTSEYLRPSAPILP